MVERLTAASKKGLLASILSITNSTSVQELVDIAVSANLDYIYILPIHHRVNSNPLSIWSVFAGNPLLIDLQKLKEEGLITSIPEIATTGDEINYEAVEETYMAALKEAYKYAVDHQILVNNTDYSNFKQSNAFWLRDYALFMGYRYVYDKPSLSKWLDPGTKYHEEDNIKFFETIFNSYIEFYNFVQYKFFTQWFELKKYANSCGIKLLGDMMPFYVFSEGVDVWAHKKLFMVDLDFQPTKVASYLYDEFGSDMQDVKGPDYNWDLHKNSGYKWWIERFKHALNMFDVLKVNPFFDGNASEEVKDLFNAVTEAIPDANFIIEDRESIQWQKIYWN